MRCRFDRAAGQIGAARERGASASSWIESRSNTRRVSGSSPAVTSSPVRQQTFSIPCSAAPARSASSASRFRSRQVSCMTGSMPSCFSAIATASGEACACADGVVGRVDGVDPVLVRREALVHRVETARVDGLELGRDDEAAGRERVLKPGHATPAASACRASSTRLIHDDVPSSRLSTGGRRSWISSFHGSLRERSTAFTQTQRISGFTSQ